MRVLLPFRGRRGPRAGPPVLTPRQGAGPPLNWRLGILERWVFVLFAGLCIIPLFVSPIRGLADNGDYWRIMEPLGVAYPGEDNAENYFGHLQREFDFVPRRTPQLLSTQSLLAELARLANPLISDGSHFDLRSLGAVNLCFYLMGVYLVLVAATTFAALPRALIALSILLAGSDLAAIAVFNSFYSESASLIFLVMLLGAALCHLRGARPAAFPLALYYAAALLFIGAKPQNTPLALPLALLPLLWPPFGARARGLRLLVVPSLALVIAAGTLFALVPREHRRWNQWNAVFTGLIADSADPAADLTELGLDPALSRWQGQGAFTEGAPVAEAMAHFSYQDLAGFYSKHPDRLLRLCRRGALETFIRFSPEIGHFEAAAGRPWGAQSRTFRAWSGFQNACFPKSLLFLAACLAAFSAGCVRILRDEGAGGRSGGPALLALGCAWMGAMQFVVILISEGTYELVKHLFLFQVLFDICLAFAVVRLGGRIGRRASGL